MNNDRKAYIISRLMKLREEQDALQRELAEISMEESGDGVGSGVSGRQMLVENGIVKMNS